MGGLMTGASVLGPRSARGLMGLIVAGDQPPPFFPDPFDPRRSMLGQSGALSIPSRTDSVARGGVFGRRPRLVQEGDEATSPGTAAPRGWAASAMPAGMQGSDVPQLPALPDSGSLPDAGGNWSATAMGAPLPRATSLPQGFDYEAMRAAMLPQGKKHSKTHSTLMDILSIAAPVLMAAGGNEAGANAFIQQQWARRDAKAKQEFEVNKLLADWQHDDWSARNKANLEASTPYTLGQGQSRYVYDPVTGQNRVIGHEQPTFDEYAQTLNLQPGTEDYFKAVEDYVLRGNGPSALEYDTQLDNTRTSNDMKLEGLRQTGRERLRGQPTYRDTHPRPVGAPRASGGRSGGAPTATGPNGQKITWNGTAWVDQQGRPVQ